MDIIVRNAFLPGRQEKVDIGTSGEKMVPDLGKDQGIGSH